MAESALADAAVTTPADPGTSPYARSNVVAPPGPTEAKGIDAPAEPAAETTPGEPAAETTPAPPEPPAPPVDPFAPLDALRSLPKPELRKWLLANKGHPLHQLLEDISNERKGQAVEQARKQEQERIQREADAERQRQYDQWIADGQQGDWDAKDKVFEAEAQRRKAEAAEQARAEILNDPAVRADFEQRAADEVIDRLTGQITDDTAAHDVWGRVGQEVLDAAYQGTPTVPDYYAALHKAIVDKHYTPNARVKELTDAAYKAGRDARNGATPNPDLTAAHEVPHSDALAQITALTDKWKRDGDLSAEEKKQLRALQA